MRAEVLMSGLLLGGAWEAGLRSAAELEEAATHFERAVMLCLAPAQTAAFADDAAWCRSQAAAM